MPNIRQFENPITGIRPNETGSSAFEVEGRHIGADIDIAGRFIGGAITEVGNAYQERETLQQLTGLQKDFTDLDTGLSQKLQQHFAGVDINDPNAGKNFQEQTLEPAVDEFLKKYEGASKQVYQRALQYAGELRKQNIMASTSEQIKLETTAADVNTQAMDKNWEEKLFTTGSDGFETILNQRRQFVSDQGEHIVNAADRARFKMLRGQDEFRLAHAAVEGDLQKPGGPERVMGDIESGRYKGIFNGDQMEQIKNSARVAQDMQATKAAKEKKATSDAAVQEYNNNLFDETGKYTPGKNGDYLALDAQITKDNRMTPEAQQTLVRFNHEMYRENVLEPRRLAREAVTQGRADERWDHQLALQQAAQDGGQYEAASRQIVDGRITSPIEIYDMANNHLVPTKIVPKLLSELDHVNKEGRDPTDPTGELSKHGYAEIEALTDDKATYNRAYFPIKAADDMAKNVRSSAYPHGIPAQERYDRASPHWIGKGIPGVDPAVPAPSTATNPSVNPASAVPPKKGPTHLPASGEVYKGYRYTGPPDGDRGDEKLWQKVQ